MECFFRSPQSALTFDPTGALFHSEVKGQEVGKKMWITYRRCGKRVAQCWHSSCSPWSIPPPLPLPSYSSLSISSNICCTCRDAALSNSYGTEKTERDRDTGRKDCHCSVLIHRLYDWKLVLFSLFIGYCQHITILLFLSHGKHYNELLRSLGMCVCVCGQAGLFTCYNKKKTQRDREKEVS